MPEQLQRILDFYRFSPYHLPKWRFCTTLSTRIDRVIPCYLSPRRWLGGFGGWGRTALLLIAGLWLASQLIEPGTLLAPLMALLVLLALLLAVNNQLNTQRLARTLTTLQQQQLALSMLEKFDAPTISGGQRQRLMSNLGALQQQLEQIKRQCPLHGGESGYFVIVAALAQAEYQLGKSGPPLRHLDPRWLTLYRELATGELRHHLLQIDQLCLAVTSGALDTRLINNQWGADFQRLWRLLYPYVYALRELQEPAQDPGLFFGRYFEYAMLQWPHPRHHPGHWVSFEQFNHYQQLIRDELAQVPVADQRPIALYLAQQQQYLLDNHPALISLRQGAEAQAVH